MKQTCIKAFIIMLVLITLLLILSYMLIGIVFMLLALLVMISGFALCLKKISTDGITVKKAVLSLVSAVGAMAVSIFLSRVVVIALFMIG